MTLPTSTCPVCRDPSGVRCCEFGRDRAPMTVTVNGVEHPAVECSCGQLMPAARLKYPVLGGMCSDCGDAARAAKPEAPEYETEVWAQGGKL